MTGKEFLEKARRASEALAGLRMELEYRMSSVTGCTQSPFDSFRYSGGEESRRESELIRYIDNSLEIRRRIYDAKRVIESCERVIDRMPNGRYQTLIRMRYMCGCTWSSIARELRIKKESAMGNYKMDAVRMFSDTYEILKSKQ